MTAVRAPLENVLSMTFTRTYSCKGPLDFWQKAIVAVPELENSVNVTLATLIYIVIYDGTMLLSSSTWVGSVTVPKGINGTAILQSTNFPPPLPSEGGNIGVTVKTRNSIQIELYDIRWQFLFEPWNGPAHLPLDPNTYIGHWKPQRPSGAGK